MLVATVIVPISIWQYDINSKSLSVKITSRVSLQPSEQSSVPGMEISIDGARLLNPYVISFEVMNDGGKPIPSADFESSIDFRLDSDTAFIRAKVTALEPKDLDAELVAERKKISLKPLLLNPKESVAITAITSGEAPVVSTKARIIGVPSVVLADGTKLKRTITKDVILGVITFLLFVASGIAYAGFPRKEGVLLRQRASAFVGYVTAIPAVFLTIDMLNDHGMEGFLVQMVVLLGLIFVGIAVGKVVNSGTQPDVSA